MDKKLLIIDERGKKYLVERGSKLETDIGTFRIPTTVKPRTVLESHLGRRGLLLEPSIQDFVEKMSRPTRILHFEDIGYVIARAGLREGQTVIEAGTGSGCCTLYFSRAVGQSGRVISFEIREDIHRAAVKNIQNFGCGSVDLINADLIEKREDVKADLFFLDLAKPSGFIELALKSLNPGGLIAAYAPFIEEGARCLKKFQDLGCMETQMTEISRRDFETGSNGTRPKTTQTVHTGYLIFGRSLPI